MDDLKSIGFIVNPSAGAKKAGLWRREITETLNKHNISFTIVETKDISDVYYDMVKELLTFHISHDSLYDILPDGLFHSIFSDFNAENRGLEFEKLKTEEINARKFFIPFDYEFFIQYVKLELILESECIV